MDTKNTGLYHLGNVKSSAIKSGIVVGAGTGIGKALLDSLKSEENLEVIGISRRGTSLTREAKIESGMNYKCDITLEEEIEVFFEFYFSKKSSLDFIYFCQGDGLFGEISQITNQQITKHFQLNVFSIIQILQKFHSLLKNSKFNPFVCILSSTAGKIGFSESVAYCASKHAVAGLAKSLREEWKKDKVRIFTIYPGAISTEIWDNREGFDRLDMISPEDFAVYLKSLVYLPGSINVEESYILPLKGIL